MIEIYQFRDFPISKQVPRTCYSCVWSMGTTTGLQCKLGHEEMKPCNRYRDIKADKPTEVNGEG